MTLRVETIGNYDIKKLPNGMYSVSLNNGNMGAFMTDEAGLLKFKEKYANKGDTADLILYDKFIDMMGGN